MFDRVRAVEPSLDILMTHSFPLAQVESAFALQERGECGKILLYPSR